MIPPLSKRLQIFLPFAVGYFLSYLYRVINAVIAPDLVADIGVDPSELGLLSAAYFITFAAFQLPLGVLLDRYGPRRVEAALLIVAALGALVFAHATTVLELVIGRGLIGFGVSACLMAAFKAYVDWFPKQLLPQINGFQMACGGLGALAGTAPVQAALALTDWRGVFTLLAASTVVVAVAIFLIIPERRKENVDAGFRSQLSGLGTILVNFSFWRIAPLAMLSQSAFLAIQTLWAGPWLRDVAGLDRQMAAEILMWVAAAMVIGYLSLGVLAERLSRRGVPVIAVAVTGMALAALLLLILVFQFEQGMTAVWILFGFCGTSGILTYAGLSQIFPDHLSGRVNTALNLLVMVAAFAAQWGVGAIIELWPVDSSGGYAPDGYRTAFGILFLFQLVGAAWYGVSGVIERRAGA